MRAVGVGLLALALVLGASAVWGVRTITAAKAETTKVAQTVVVVAAKPIGFGEALTPQVLKAQAWPAGAQPDGAFTTVAELTSGQPRVALRPIAANEPILLSRISGPGARATLSGTIEAGKRAVTIRVNDVIGVAGFVLPGDFVDVLITRDASSGGGQVDMRTDVLLESVRVLAVDQTANETKNDPVVAKAATVEVDPAQAQKLALAAQVGTLSLSLRGTTDAPVPDGATDTATVRVSDLRLRGAPEPIVRVATESRPRPAARPRAAVAPQGPTMDVVRGGQSTRVSVSSE